MSPQKDIQLGLRENWQQFALLLLINAFVGAMVGLERTVVPLIAKEDFGIMSATVTLSFIIGFGAVKAASNLFTGGLADRIGRKKLLVSGWLIGLPVPLIIILAPTWTWIVAANILLGVNQGLCWSTTVIMKIDLVGPRQRGLAMGLNEATGYLAVSASALLTGYLAARYALRPQPFLLGIGLAALGLILSGLTINETRDYARLEAKSGGGDGSADRETAPTFWQAFRTTTWDDRTLFAASQAGLVNNLNDGMIWGLLPIFLSQSGLGVDHIGVIAAVYPAVWGLGQLGTGALSDRWGRKLLIISGLWIQSAGILMLLFVHQYGLWITAAAAMGVGTALVYPTLLASIADIVPPGWRASAVGVYRFWRDMGYVVGALLSGIIADLLGIGWAIGAIGGLTAISGVIVRRSMRETLSTGWITLERQDSPTTQEPSEKIDPVGS